MRRHLLTAATAGVTVLLGALLTLAVSGTASTQQRVVHAPVAGTEPIVLRGDVTPRVRRLVAVVLSTVRQHGLQIAASELEIRFVNRIQPGEPIGGWTDGHRILVGRNVALPERTILHEVAHAVVGLEHGHGEPWRSVYVTAIRHELGDRSADRELRRIRWVYDKSYLDALP